MTTYTITIVEKQGHEMLVVKPTASAFSVYTRAIQYVYFKYKTLEVAIGYSTNVIGLIYMLKHSNNTCMYKEQIYHCRDCAPDQDFIDSVPII
jgi:hypothetical protein